MAAPKNNNFAGKPEEEKRTIRVMLQFTEAEKKRLNAWAAGERLTDKMRKAVLAAVP